ncbi:response regulator transcription factor [Conexibacter sp. JD483]|uniref:response regulator n=1 Tax=unclassified Conexibacter TaxID=2627773 RepID=UPI002719DBC4|nr:MULTISPECIES: response regulator transcription factor [unclassified Conexibacter]MDO8185202.1 response regulator transcription factor [Conexibacter sp. CPCC 205706]MDO8198248.1 response regulator transcription factor [Conexibacter sp. CPCC 205762]MDR9367790.1 response regulator transcription factor [Conexibacter sp. JD483]
MNLPLRKVVLVDDHAIFRAGLKAGLGPTIEVVGEAGTVEEAIGTIRALDPDVVLLDVHLPDGGGQAVIPAVHAERPGVRFLALSVSDAAEDVVAVIRAGARGYVTKSIAPDELVDAIHKIADGDAVFSPWLAGFVLDAFGGGEAGDGARGAPATIGAADPELDQLTAREQDVLLLIARGYLYKEIGARLHISVKTVESHVSNVLRKLQLSNRAELTRWAAQRRMI